jgi:hypothetical protein
MSASSYQAREDLNKPRSKRVPFRTSGLALALLSFQTLGIVLPHSTYTMTYGWLRHYLFRYWYLAFVCPQWNLEHVWPRAFGRGCHRGHQCHSLVSDSSPSLEIRRCHLFPSLRRMSTFFICQGLYLSSLWYTGRLGGAYPHAPCNNSHT